MGVISLESRLLFFIRVVQFYVEIFVWFPNIVVVNSNLNRSVLLGSLHFHDLVNRIVVILGDSISLHSSNTEVDLLVNVLLNNYLNESTTFCDGVVEAVEAKTAVSDNLFLCESVHLKLNFLSLKLHEVFVLTNLVGFLVSDSLQH